MMQFRFTRRRERTPRTLVHAVGVEQRVQRRHPPFVGCPEANSDLSIRRGLAVVAHLREPRLRSILIALRMKQTDSPAGSDPHPAAAVFKNFVYRAGGQSIFFP